MEINSCPMVPSLKRLKIVPWATSKKQEEKELIPETILWCTYTPRKTLRITLPVIALPPITVNIKEQYPLVKCVQTLEKVLPVWLVDESTLRSLPLA